MTVFVISATQLRDKIGETLNRVLYGGERVLIERRGEPVAAVISIEELKYLEKLEDERDAEILRLAKAQATQRLPVQALLDQYEKLFGEPFDPSDQSK